MTKKTLLPALTVEATYFRGFHGPQRFLDVAAEFASSVELVLVKGERQAVDVMSPRQREAVGHGPGTYVEWSLDFADPELTAEFDGLLDVSVPTAGLKTRKAALAAHSAFVKAVFHARAVHLWEEALA